MNDRSYRNLDSDGNCAENLVYLDSPDWKKDIRIKNLDNIRILTYNVHGFTDRKQKPTFNEIMDVIKRINPDIIVIEEFVLYGVKKQITYSQFKKILSDLGFVAITTDRLQNNVTASKFPATINPTIELGRDPTHNIWRFANLMIVDLSGIDSSPLILVGTHLDVYDETGKTRIKQANMICETIDDEVENMRVQALISNKKFSEPIIIVTGDFNCLRPDDYDDYEWNHMCRVDRMRGVDTHRMKSKVNQKIDAITVFESVNLIDASVQLQNPINLSVWANRRVDYICGRNIDFKQATAVRIASSDHYPVYADFRPQKH